MSGSIPIGIANLISLETLSLEVNQFTGPIPSSIGRLQRLNALYMDENRFSGPIPFSLGNLTSLVSLYLDDNNLNGNIPPSLGKCQNLLALGLSKNNLSGFIPVQVFSLSSLAKVLDLSKSRLTGSIPVEVGKLVNLGYLSLSYNMLSGKIPETLGMCTSLENLYLDHNYLQGSIPQPLDSLRGLEEIDFSSNNLSGKIPMYLESFKFLHDLDLSFNSFEGDVPIRGIFSNASACFMEGNTKLCGGIPEFKLLLCSSRSNVDKRHKQFHKAKLIILVSCGLVALLLILLVILVYMSKKNGSKSNFGSSSVMSLLQISYGELLKATNGFSSESLVGAGSFGAVYKGLLLNDQEERVVAVKVLNLQNLRSSKIFIAECKALINIRHRNLVRVLTVCSSIDFQGNEFKALVYEFMVNGSLEEWLHPDKRENLEEGQRHLSIMQRMNIAIDVVSATTRKLISGNVNLATL